MTRETFLLIAVAYYAVTMIIVVIVLVLMNKKYRKNITNEINSLERDKNLIISSSIMSELNKVEALVNNDELKKRYENWQKRFESIRDEEIPKITDEIIELQDDFNERDYDKLKKGLVDVELNINYLKTKADFLLDEIKEITLSEERNRETIIKLKADYREIRNLYNTNINDFEIVKNPIELQFENVDKLFSAFEDAMEKNEYLEVGKIVKAIDDLIGNLKVVINETKIIVNLGSVLIPKRIDDINNVYHKMKLEGYNLEYLNIEYNIDEANKKIQDVFSRLNVLNVVDSVFELKTMLDYFDSLYNDFDKERITKKLYEEYKRSILIKVSKLEKINNELYRKIDDIKYSYDLSDDEVLVISEIKEEFNNIRASYDRVVEMERNKTLAYSRLSKEMEILNNKLTKAEEKLNIALRTLGSLKEDELRARDQLDEIKDILIQAKEKVRSYKLPVIPKNYYVELSEATLAINEMVKELDKRPISIKTLNLRVDTARDLVLKVYNTINETIKTAKMAETAIVYGNRYRVVNKDVDLGLTKAENSFYKGNFKNSLENAINAINIIEPGIHKRLLDEYK
ncbi:MAG: septation ring formation regulator EzrA [Bacilli bacterium]|nr:septation ring formation regulator EzrA [Bacilli bacterium]